MQVLMMLKRIHLIMIIIIKKGENVNHAGFDDAKTNSLDNDCHYQKGGNVNVRIHGFDDAKI